jgi:hypothetical protein
MLVTGMGKMVRNRAPLNTVAMGLTAFSHGTFAGMTVMLNIDACLDILTWHIQSEYDLEAQSREFNPDQKVDLPKHRSKGLPSG